MGIGISTGVSFGNGAQRAAGHWAEQLSATGEQSVLGVYVESANEPDLLERLAKAATQQPVIVCVGPAGGAAAAVAARHTGAVGGDAIPQEWPPGVVAVRATEQLTAALAWYARRPLPPAPARTAVVTISGGVGVAAVAALTRAGAVLAQPAEATLRAVRDAAGGGLVRAENPVDLGPRYLSRKVAARTLAALRADAGVDVTVFHLTWDHLLDVDRANPGYAAGYLDLLLSHGSNADDFCVYFPRVLDDLSEHDVRAVLRARGIPVFDSWDAIAPTLAATAAGGRTA
jgi:acyl-CoA synthetase (NDP forming)